MQEKQSKKKKKKKMKSYVVIDALFIRFVVPINS